MIQEQSCTPVKDLSGIWAGENSSLVTKGSEETCRTPRYEIKSIPLKCSKLGAT